MSSVNVINVLYCYLMLSNVISNVSNVSSIVTFIEVVVMDEVLMSNVIVMVWWYEVV